MQRAIERFGLFLFILLVCSVERTSAQTTSTLPIYWRHEAAARITHTFESDIDQDGFGEFGLVTIDDTIELLRNDRTPLWSTPHQTGAGVLAVTARADAVVYATSQQLVQVGANGEIEWTESISTLATVKKLYPVVDIIGRSSLLILFNDGTMQLYNRTGSRRWQYDPAETLLPIHDEIVVVADVDEDGLDDILFGYSRGQNESHLVVIDSQNGSTKWDVTVAGQITAIAPVSFTGGASAIAVGTADGAITLVGATQQSNWEPQNLGHAVSALVMAEWPQADRILIAATIDGQIVGFGATGRPIFVGRVCEQNGIFSMDDDCNVESRSRIRRLEVAFGEEEQGVALVAMAEREGESSAEILFLNRSLDLLQTYPISPIATQPLLVDSNRDGRNEFLLTAFGSVDLISLSTTRRSPLQINSTLPSPPSAILVGDFDQDFVDEMIVGDVEGRLSQYGSGFRAEWIEPETQGASVEKLALLASPEGGSDYFLTVYNRLIEQGEGEPPIRNSTLALRRTNDGSLVWEEAISISGHTVTLLVEQSQPDLVNVVVGLDNGVLAAFELTYSDQQTFLLRGSWELERDWSFSLPSEITYGALLNRDTESGSRIVISTRNTVQRYDFDGTRLYFIEVNNSTDFCESPAELVYLLDNGGDVSQPCLLNRRLGLWEQLLGSSTQNVSYTSDTYSYQPIRKTAYQRTDWSLIGAEDVEAGTRSFGGESETINDVVAFHSGDMTGNGRQDIAIGRLDGSLLLDLNGANDTTLQFGSRVLFITELKDAVSTSLNVLTENSLIHRLTFQPNYPPLLGTPQTTLDDEQVTIQLSLFDPEGDEVSVVLEQFDPLTESWIAQPAQRTTGQIERLQWQVDAPLTEEGAAYRVYYSDSAGQEGRITPSVPLPIVVPATPIWNRWLPLATVVLLIGGSILFIRQQQSPRRRAARLVRLIERTPALTLSELRRRYNILQGDPSFFLNVSTIARQYQNSILAALADGLYLVADRPNAALAVINNALGELSSDVNNYQQWTSMFGSTEAFLEVQTLTELSLMRPRLAEMLEFNDETGGEPGSFPQLMPIFEALQDAERVDTVEDRLTYLGDAEIMLRRLEQSVEEEEYSLSKVLVQTIVTRWRGLVTATIEALRGRARLDVQLKTQRIAPTEAAQLALEIQNIGRAAAEQVVITLQAGDALPVNGTTKTIPLLAPERKRTVQFGVELPEADAFRVAFQITYSDRQQEDRTLNYANLVHVLSPVRDFRPIRNPYSPGTPLRRDSSLFFGRNDLFNFIATEAGRASQQHVLILVGQRRTGKTSALLRLSQHLPDNLIPVYIDCQSLGVLPGITAFFQDVAWQIADVLLEHDIDIDVPELEEKRVNPGKWFQRDFIPFVREQLPNDAKIVLVFDEFEALENLVNDDILPRTIFAYMRHLMQHGEGLSFIFVGTHRLEEMTTNYWSVLFNIALYKEISYLDHEAARRLICEPVAPNLTYDDLAIDKITRLTAGHPYFLQLVCYSLVKRANQQRTGYITITDVNETVDEMLGLGEVHFAYIWQRSSSAERVVLITIAHLVDRELPFRVSDIVAALDDYRIELTPADVTAALQSLVQRNVVREVNQRGNTHYEMKLGLVGQWVERTKSVDKLFGRMMR